MFPPISYSTNTQGTTSNFVVMYETADRGANVAYTASQLTAIQRRAQAILDTCESDYAILCNWFGIAVGDGFGSSNRVQVTLTTLKYGGGGSLNGAYNLGYGHPSQIFINPYSSPGQADPSFDNEIPSLFVAELIEILMSKQGTWNAGTSSGEGLSRVAAEMLHPAIAGSVDDPAPSDIFNWMNDSSPNNAGWGGGPPSTLPSHTMFRQDWVSNEFSGEDGVAGDGDWYSFGCAILFIYYLKDQLHFTMPQIVQTHGSTLEDRFHSLSGRSGGFAPFRALLDEFYPSGAPLPPVYDVFPLGGANCLVQIGTSLVQDQPPEQTGGGTGTLGTLCGPRQFRFTLFDLHEHLHLSASVDGFAHPVVQWSINGNDVPAAGMMGFSVDALVITDDPSTGTQVFHHGMPVMLNVTVGPSPQYPDMTTFLDVAVAGHPGQVHLDIGLSATDQFATASANEASSFASGTIHTTQLSWDPQARRVQEECWNKYITGHSKPPPYLLFMPDPPPDLLYAASLISELTNTLHELSRTDPEATARFEKQFALLLVAGIRPNSRK